MLLERSNERKRKRTVNGLEMGGWIKQEGWRHIKHIEDVGGGGCNDGGKEVGEGDRGEGAQLQLTQLKLL